MKSYQRFFQFAALGIVLSTSGSIIPATSATATPHRSDAVMVNGPMQPIMAGNPCKNNKNTKACRDWILGNPKPPIRPKRK